MRINGANARTVEQMSDYLRLLWLTPAMDGLFTGPAGDRRRFLDRLVTTLIPSHSATVADYEKAMRQRNRLLEEQRRPALARGARDRNGGARRGAAFRPRRRHRASRRRGSAESLDDGAFPPPPWR